MTSKSSYSNGNNSKYSASLESDQITEAKVSRGSRDHSPDPFETRKPKRSLNAVRADEQTEYLRGAQKLGVGKYRGRTFDYVSTQHFYVRWVLQLQYPTGELGQLQRYLILNRDRLLQEQVEAAQAAEGTLSTRTRLWNRGVFTDRGYLAVVPTVGNATFDGTRRPRQPCNSLQTAGVVAAWEPKWTTGEKNKAKTTMALSARAIAYLFRRMVHIHRGEPVTEPLVADSALRVLGINHYAYKTAMVVTGGDPDKVVTPDQLKDALDAKRQTVRNPVKRALLPESFDLTRIGNPQELTPRRLLLRYMLTLPELRNALQLFRDITIASTTDDPRWPELINACWILARADGAFNWARISNERCPEALKVPDLPVVRYMNRTVKRCFSVNRVDYQPCLNFSGGCPLDADFVIGDTVFAVRGGLWLSSGYDGSYTQGYAALARNNGRTINRVALVYLQHGCDISIDLTDWDHKPLLQFLQANDGAEAKQNNACDVGMCDPDIPKELDIDPEEDEITQRSKKLDSHMRRQARAAGVRNMPKQNV
jgi:uncharacterized protein (DUF3820 family)